MMRKEGSASKMLKISRVFTGDGSNSFVLNQPFYFHENLALRRASIDSHPDYTLMVKLFEKTKDSMVINEADDILKGYYPLLLNDHKGSFIFQEYTINLLPPPPMLIPKNVEPLPIIINFAVSEMPDIPLPPSADDLKSRVGSATSKRSYSHMDTSLVYIENKKSISMSQINTSKEDLYVFIDSVRYLPTNASATRISVALYNSINPLTSVYQAFSYPCDFTQRFDYCSYNGKMIVPWKDLKATSVLVLTLESMHKASQRPQILGYSYLQLSDGKQTNPLNILLGYFQLPIYCEALRPELFDRRLKANRIPVASLLIRIEKYPRVNPQIPPIIPEYSAKLYVNQTFNPTKEEILKMKNRLTVGNKINSVDKEIEVMKGSSTIPNKNWFESKFANPASYKNNIANPSYYFPMTPMGLQFCIDGLINHLPSNNLPHVCLVSVNSPASLYRNPPSKYLSFFFTTFDYDSTITYPRYNSSYITIYNRLQLQNNFGPEPGSHLIIDIRAVDVTGNKLIPVGWTMFPLFYFQDTFCFANTGYFALPIFKGEVNKLIIFDIASKGNKLPFTTMVNLFKDKSLPLLESTVVLLRTRNSVYSNMYETPMDLGILNGEYMSSDAFADLRISETRMKQGDKLLTLIPPKMASIEEFQRMIDDIIEKVML